MRARVGIIASTLALLLASVGAGAASGQADTSHTSTKSASATGAAATSPAISAADSALEARTRVVAAQLRCPVCQGLSLQDSPSELAQEMRGVVKEQLRAGRTPDQVKQYFINRYGEWILMEPQAHGFNWVVYGLPAFVLIGGLALIYVALRRWTAGALAPDGGHVAHSTAASRDAPTPGE